MTEEEKKKRKSLITGVIVGGAVGSVISLLFAPKKGAETRASVSKKGTKWFKNSIGRVRNFIKKTTKKS